MRIQEPKQTSDIYSTSQVHDTPQLSKTGLSCDSILVSANTSNKAVELFWKGWSYCKSAALKVWDLIVWVITGCCGDSAKIAIIEQMLEDPKGKAASCAANFDETMTQVLQAALSDPAQVQQLIEDNEQEYITFCKEFLKHLRDKGLLPNITKKQAEIIKARDDAKKTLSFAALKQQVNFLKDNIVDLFAILANSCEEIKKILYTSSQIDNPTLTALKALFEKTFPDMIELVQRNPDDYKALVEEFFKLNAFNDETIIPLLKRHFPEQAKEEGFEQNLRICLKANAQVFKELQTKMAKEEKYGLDRQIDINRVLLQSVTVEQLKKFLPIFTKDETAQKSLINVFAEVKDSGANIADQNFEAGLNLVFGMLENFKKPPQEREREEN